MRIQTKVIPTSCPSCGADVSLMVDRYFRAEGTCDCGRRILTSLPRVTVREVALNPCLCGGRAVTTTAQDSSLRRVCAVTCLQCHVTLLVPMGDAINRWNSMTIRRTTPEKFLDAVKTDMTEEVDE